MEIGLIQILKVSNAPLVFFYRVTSWVREHEGNIKQNGTDSLAKCHKIIQDINIKLYRNEIMMKLTVDNIHLSSGWFQMM